MNDNTLILVGVLVGSTVGWLCIKLLQKYWPKSGKMGMNLDGVSCPQCGKTAPKIRKPANARQFLWGGWSCSKCGTEMDKYGARINS